MFLTDDGGGAQSAPNGALDELDKKIIMQLAEDGRRSYRQIAQNLGIAEGTARFRANRLMDEGYVKVTAVGNAQRLGIEVIAVTLLRLEPGRVTQAADHLATYRNVRFVGMSFGSADIIIQTLHRSQKDLHRFLAEELPAALPAIRGMETFQLAEVVKSSWDWEAWLNLAGEHHASEPEKP